MRKSRKKVIFISCSFLIVSAIIYILISITSKNEKGCIGFAMTMEGMHVPECQVKMYK